MDDTGKEILEEYLDSWIETHKKSAVLFVILTVLSEQSLWAKDIQAKIVKITSWEITERGLYRSLQRMEKQGLLEHVRQNALKTGADRKIYQLTDLGRSLLREISSEMQYLNELIIIQ